MIVPEVGKVYKCPGTPSGYILVTRVGELDGVGVVAGWGDGYGDLASSKVVVSSKRLRNTRRQGPFSGISKEKAMESAQGWTQPT